MTIRSASAGPGTGARYVAWWLSALSALGAGCLPPEPDFPPVYIASSADVAAPDAAHVDTAVDAADAAAPDAGPLDLGAGGIQAVAHITGTSLYFFRGRSYARFDVATGRIANNYPLPVAGYFAGGWPTWLWVDAAVNLGNGGIYFFAGREYVRYDLEEGRVFEAPRPIEGHFAAGWPGWGGVDAAVNLGDGNVYFFRERTYFRYDIVSGRVIGGARAIDDGFCVNWPDWPAIDGAVSPGDGSAYFFRGDHYFRYDIGTRRVVDGHPRAITDGLIENWIPPVQW